MATTKPPQSSPYFSNGQILQGPPLSVRLLRSVDSLYAFFGLYFVTLFALIPSTAAEGSRFNTIGNPNQRMERPRWGTGPRGGGGGGGGGGGSDKRGGGGGGGAGGGGGKKVGRIDDVRSPECGSCG